MATKGVPKWSTTASSNGNIDSNINYLEGMAPSQVNDSARGLMASVAGWRNDLNGITTAGSATAYTVSTYAVYASEADMSGMIFAIIPHVTSGAAPTLAVDGLTARAINDSTGVAVATGALIQNTPYFVKYVLATTEFILLDRTNVFATLKANTNIIAAPGTTAGRPAAVSGGFRFNTDTALPEFSDGTNWFSLIKTLSGAQMPYGGVVNGTIVESHASNAVTFALKTLAGNDPSVTDPVLLAFRNVTAATGNYVYQTVTTALSFTISSGSKLGTTNGTPFQLWLVLFNDAGTIRLGAINCLSGTNIYPLGQMPIASSTAEGGLGAANSAQTFYTGTAVTSVAYLILGYAAYEAGLTTAGSWAASPTRIQLYGPGCPLPGQNIQTVSPAFGNVTATTNNTGSPVSSNITANITLSSAANLVRYFLSSTVSNANGGSNGVNVQVYRGSTAIGPVARTATGTANNPAFWTIAGYDAPGATSLTYVAKHVPVATTTSSVPSVNTDSASEILEEIMA